MNIFLNASLWSISALFFASPLHAQEVASSGIKAIFETNCIACHTADEFREDTRSAKAWELTVANMRKYATFTDGDARQIVDYLVTGGFLHDYFPATSPETQVATAITVTSPVSVPVQPPTLSQGPSDQPAVAAISTVSAPTPLVTTPQSSAVPPVHTASWKEQRRKQMAISRFWNPSPGFLRLARYFGYGGIACLVLLAFTGLYRRALALHFRQVHNALAVAFIVLIVLHTGIYLFKYGTPPVLWLWFGIVASVTPAVSEWSGLARRRLKMRFKPLHYGTGFACLVFSVLHWIWAWL